MSRRRRYLLIVLLSAAAHLPGISSPVLDYHYHRQSNTAAIARNYHLDGLPFMHPRVDWEGADDRRAGTEFPLYMWLVGLFWSLGGLGALWGRLFSALFSALAALALYRFLDRWIGERPAFFAALMFSLVPLEVYFGRTVQPEALALCSTIASFWAFDAFLAARAADRLGAWAWGAAWFAASLAIAHKLPYAYLLGVCGIMAWTRLGKRIFTDPGVILFPVLTAAAVLSWYKYASSGSYVVPTKEGQFRALLDYGRLAYYAQFQFISRFPELSVGWPGLLFFGAGLAALRSRSPETKIFLGGWWACVAFDLVLGGGYSFHHEYTSLPFAPVNAALMGLGLESLIDKAAALPAPARNRARAALSVFLIAMPVYAGIRIKHWYNINYPFLLEAREVVAEISRPEDLFLTNHRAQSLYLFQIRRRGWSKDIEEEGSDPIPWFREKIAAGAKFFLTAKAAAFADPKHPLSRGVFAAYPVAHDGGDFLIFELTPTSGN